jgi:hypothetical protein
MTNKRSSGTVSKPVGTNRKSLSGFGGLAPKAPAPTPQPPAGGTGGKKKSG